MQEDLPEYMPILRRSYRTLCSVCEDEIVSVFNVQRLGGICHCCIRKYKASLIISKWLRSVIRKRKQKIVYQMTRQNIKVGINSGIAQNINKFI